MVRGERRQPPKTLWTYAYHIVPPQTECRLRTITALLDDEHADAQRGTRTWVGRVVFGLRITHILILSDGPGQARDINDRLEAELGELKMGFSISAPMAVVANASLKRPRRRPSADEAAR